MTNLANIKVDENLFRERLQAFLRSSYSEVVWATLTTGGTEHFAVNGLYLFAGFIQLFTVIWTWNGMKMIWAVLSGKVSAGIENCTVTRATPEKIHPLLAACIIIGPDRKHALGLGTFQKPNTYTFDWLAERAEYFGRLYADGPQHSSEESMVALMKDDMYEPFRRRRVPEPFAGGVELYLLDIEVDPNEVILTPFPFFAFAVTDPGPDGLIAALPKVVAEGAIAYALTAQLS
jgi:hypothetical protein